MDLKRMISGEIDTFLVDSDSKLLKAINSVRRTGKKAIIKVGDFALQHPRCIAIAGVSGIMTGGSVYMLSACSVSAAVIVTGVTGAIVGTVSYLLFDKALRDQQTRIEKLERQLSRKDEDNKKDIADLKANMQKILTKLEKNGKAQ